MSLSIWENIDNLNFNVYECIKNGFLRNNKGEISLFRDNESQLLLKVIGDATVSDFNFKDKEGWISREESRIEFKHKFLEQKIVMSALPLNRTITQKNGRNSYIDVYLVSEFQFTDNHSSIGAEYLIEFVDNLKINHIFPHSMKMKETHEKEYEFYGTNFMLIQKIINQDNSTRNSIKFKIEEDEIFIIKTNDGDKGVIIYERDVELEKREKIRKTISFILGCPLVFYGYTFVNKYMTPSSSYLRNISDNEMGQLNINVQVPASLSLYASNIIESNLFQNLIQEFYVKYEEYDLGNIFLTYWIAVNSNSIMVAVHYGALIEKLQANYMKINDVSYSKILDRSVFKKLRKQFELQFKDFELTDEQKNIFLNKIGNMNTYSQKDKMNFFCKDISLELSEIENIAWQQRNDAAHGNDIGDIDQAWRNTLILRELVNRFLLKLLTANKYYLSYLEGNPKIKDL